MAQSTSKALQEQESKLKAIRDSKKSAMADLKAQQRVRTVASSACAWVLMPFCQHSSIVGVEQGVPSLIFALYQSFV